LLPNPPKVRVRCGVLLPGLAKCGGCIRERGAGWEKPASEPAKGGEDRKSKKWKRDLILENRK